LHPIHHFLSCSCPCIVDVLAKLASVLVIDTDDVALQVLLVIVSVAVVTEANNTAVTVVVADGVAVCGLRDDVVAVKLVVCVTLSCAHTTCVVLHLDVIPLGEKSDSAPFKVMTAVAPGVAHGIVCNAHAVIVDKLILPSGACVLVSMFYQDILVFA